MKTFQIWQANPLTNVDNIQMKQRQAWHRGTFFEYVHESFGLKPEKPEKEATGHLYEFSTIRLFK